jgi:hypothetical protein
MKPKKTSTPADTTATTERDQGYGPSHGYGPGHGGPTGPGDVPGDEAPGPTSPTREHPVRPRKLDRGPAAGPGSDPDPDDDAIRDGLSGNLCRCTGYQGIVAAVKSAAAARAGAPS